MSTVAVLEWLESGDPAAASARDLRDLELRIFNESKAVLAVSDAEKAVIQHYQPSASVYVVSNVYSQSHQPPLSTANRSGLLFVGNMLHAPNG